MALLLYYIVIDYQVVLNADSAVKNVLAQEIYETGSYFPREWNYVNGDLWVFYTHTFILALLPFFPNSFALNAVSNLVSTALILSGTWLVGSVLGFSRRARLGCLLLLTGGISPFMAENLFGQASYGSMYYMACYLLYFSWRLLHAEGRGRWGWGVATALVIVLVVWANPQRAAVLYCLPLMAAAGVLWAAGPGSGQPGEPDWRRRVLLLMAVVAVSAVVGVLLYRIVMPQGRAAPLWLSFTEMLANTLAVLQGLLSVLGALPPEGQAVKGGLGVYHAMRLLSGLVVLALIPAALCRALDGRHRGRLMGGVFALTVLGLSLFVMLTTNVAAMAAANSSVRYLVPALLLLLVLLAGAVVDGQGLRAPARLAGLAALVVLAASAPSALHQPYAPGYFPAGGAAAQNSHARLAEYLRSQGLRYGYASYWNASPITVYSANRVRVRQIELQQGLPLPQRFLASDRWYRANAWDGQTFLLFSPEEAQKVDWIAMAKLLGEPARTLSFEGWRIVVYADNIARHLPDWGSDMDLLAPRLVPITANSRHAIGRLEGTPSLLVAEPGEAGPLHFGPYMTLQAGKYIATFNVEAIGKDGDFGRVDVIAGQGTGVLATQVIGAGKRQLQLPFTLTRAQHGMEFRVLTNGAGRVRLSGLELTRVE